MKAEEVLLYRVNNPDFLSISGSCLYGTDRPDSDHDLRGFVMPPFEYLLGNYKFNDMDLPGDHKVFSVRRFLELVLNGDPQLTELFFVSEEHIRHKTAIADRIFVLREHIISNACYGRVMGYSNSEWRKAMGVKQVIEERTRTEDTVINDVREIFHPNKESMDSIIGTLYKDRERKLVPSVAGLGGKRKAEVEKYGYCVSSAAHSIRLVGQVTELMLTGEITFPRPNSDLLRSIRLGEVSKDDVEKIYEEKRKCAKASRENSVLPDEPNRNKVWEEYLKLVVDYITVSTRFFEFDLNG